MKNILFLTEGDKFQASARVRAIQYYPLLQNTYKLFHIARIKDKRSMTVQSSFIKDILFKCTKQARLFFTFVYILCIKTDLIFIQRWKLPFLIRQLIAFKKIKVIFDIDDAVYQGHENTFRDIVHLSSCITASTEELISYCKKISDKPIHLIYSPVDTQLILPCYPQNSVIQIGWLGSSSTSKYLKEIESVFVKLAKANIQFELIVLGDTWNSDMYANKSMAWSPENELKALCQIDIGIMPLDNSEWAKNKGGYKLFLYMAAGKPVVASPTGINAFIVEHGTNGFQANNHSEWFEYLSLLIKDADLRKKLGESGRKKCVQTYSYEHNAKILIDTINTII